MTEHYLEWCEEFRLVEIFGGQQAICEWGLAKVQDRDYGPPAT
jgi:hypothetical protein